MAGLTFAQWLEHRADRLWEQARHHLIEPDGHIFDYYFPMGQDTVHFTGRGFAPDQPKGTLEMQINRLVPVPTARREWSF